MPGIVEKINALPPELQQEVEDFVEFLTTKQRPHRSEAPAFSWAGALKDRCGDHSSVEIQHMLSQFRIGER